MSVARAAVESALSPPLPQDVVSKLLDVYCEIKQQMFLGKFRPGELDGGRFAECALRIVEFLDKGSFTVFGTQLNGEKILRSAESNINLHESLRFFVPRLARIIADIRNRRDVAHVGGDVSPGLGDCLLVSHAADWILTELIRLLYNCPVDDARKLADSVNQTTVPIVADVRGFLRVQDTSLTTRDKVLVILYHKDPEPVADIDITKWLRYKNSSRMRTDILCGLDAETLIHRDASVCTILPKGKKYVESHIRLELLV